MLNPTLLPKDTPIPKASSAKAQWAGLVSVLIANDLLAAYSACVLAYVIRFQLNIPLFQEVEPSFQFYQILIWILTPLWLSTFKILGLYQEDNLLGGTKEYALVFRAIVIGVLLLMVSSFLDVYFVFARAWLLMAWFFATTFTIAGRLIIRRTVYWLRSKGYFLKPALLIGLNEESLSLAQQLLSWTTSGLVLEGYIATNDESDNQYSRLPRLGTLDDLDRVVRDRHVGEIIMATSALSREQMISVFLRYGMNNDINLRLSSGIFEILTTGLEVKEMACVPLISVNRLRLTELNRTLKRAVELSLLVPALLLTSPVFIAIAFAIRFSSPGPVFHRRRVLGLNGKQFDAFKFRTMLVNGDELLDANPELRTELEQNHKLKFDPRITTVGHLLRRYSLDELPQLFNILFGQMSLIGPRMIAPAEISKFGKWGHNLLTVKPGLTGLWQISGRSDLSYEDRVNLDMHYIRNWSIWLDFQILMRTPMIVLSAKGAY